MLKENMNGRVILYILHKTLARHSNKNTRQKMAKMDRMLYNKYTFLSFEIKEI